jgi:hypothetical protein
MGEKKNRCLVEKRELSEDLQRDGRIILKWILRKQRRGLELDTFG